MPSLIFIITLAIAILVGILIGILDRKKFIKNKLLVNVLPASKKLNLTIWLLFIGGLAIIILGIVRDIKILVDIGSISFGISLFLYFLFRKQLL
ncbi:MAG: hypothetical protein WC711_02145 [Candidatus Staskawiczbacteria bacterium]|jgi:hypothetical protein